MDTVDLTWRDKLRIIDITARVAASMFLAVAAVSQLVVVVVSH
jgi:hypothetical protein